MSVVCNAIRKSAPQTGTNTRSTLSRNNCSSRSSELSSTEKFTSKDGRNPFKLPANTDYAKILEEEQQNRKSRFKEMISCPVHQKTPLRHKSFGTILQTIPTVSEIQEKPPSPSTEIRNDPDFVQAVAKGEKQRNMEDLTTFIENKREMFITQYLIGIKQDEVLRMKRKEEHGGKGLGVLEQNLEDDAVKFSDFLRINDRQTVEAVKQAEMETRAKLDKIAEIKKINVQMVNYKSKISKLEDILLEYKTYAKFLNYVAPLEWKEQKRKEQQIARENRDRITAELNKERSESQDKNKRLSIVSTVSNTGGLSILPQSRKASPRKNKDKSSTASKGSNDVDDSVHHLGNLLSDLHLNSDLIQYLLDDEDDETVELYFSKPDQLRGIFTDLEEKNLRLIQNSQEIDDSLDEVNFNFKRSKKKLKNEAKLLKEQVENKERLLEMETRNAANFEVLVKMHSYGIYDEEAHESVLTNLSAKIEEVYTKCFGPNDANLNALQMLTCIEGKLEEMLEALEKLPSSEIAEAMKLRQRERRVLEGKKKARQQEKYLQERRLRTMAKAVEVHTALVKRRLTFRSPHPVTKMKVKQKQMRSKSDEEFMYFFM